MIRDDMHQRAKNILSEIHLSFSFIPRDLSPRVPVGQLVKERGKETFRHRACIPWAIWANKTWRRVRQADLIAEMTTSSTPRPTISAC